MDNHILNIENRKSATISEIIEVESFTEELIVMALESDFIIIKGEKLHVTRLDLQEGIAEITGEIMSVSYTKKKRKSKNEKSCFWKRLFS